MIRALLWTLAVVVVGLSVRGAVAATCTITGSVRLESEDSYYCDTNHTSCTGWFEVDLDSKTGANAVPLRYMEVDVYVGGSQIGRAFSDANGAYSVSFQNSICAGSNVQLVFVFARVHESDRFAPTPRYRFHVTTSSGNSWSASIPVTLTGTTTNYSYTFTRPASTAGRFANVYYTFNSALTEVISWSNRLLNYSYFNATFIGNRFQVWHYSGSGPGEWGLDHIKVAWGNHHRGNGNRHEFGHTIHHIVNQELRTDCRHSYDYQYTSMNNAPSYGFRDCEWGYTAVDEAMALFFATRSVTVANNAWACSCGSTSNQDLCTETAVSSFSGVDSDRMKFCPSTSDRFIGIGDAFANSTARCANLGQTPGNTEGCDCDPDDGTLCPISNPNFRLTQGWMNRVQVARFLWDMIDSQNETNDNENFTMPSLIASMESMPCTFDGVGVDGNCNEFQQSKTVPRCNPVSGNSLNISQSTPKSVHKYNVWDLAELFPGDQGSERILNCVQGAID